MKIAFFSDTYHPSVDGVVRSIDYYISELKSRGHEVKVFAPSPQNKQDEKDGVSYAGSIEFSPYPQYRIPYGIRKCVRDAIEFKPDIVHSHAMVVMGLAARDAAKKANCPLVGTFHTSLPDAGHYVSGHEGVQMWFKDISWRYFRWLYRDFDALISPSKYMQNVLLQKNIESHVLANPIDTSKFSPIKPDEYAQEWFASKKRNILFFGRIAKEKNLDFLLDVANSDEFKKSGMKIVIAGDGPYKKILEKKVKKYSLLEIVKFAGRVPEEHVASFYSAADCSFFPSKFETQGMTALESLSCGTPVVALRGTALEEVIEQKKTGQVCIEDAHSAFLALDFCTRNKKKMCANARKSAMKYTIKKCTDGLLEIYKAAKRNKEKTKTRKEKHAKE
ncbi:MAG: glycosyltransferase [Candidatus Micrarchaeia archaeon]